MISNHKSGCTYEHAQCYNKNIWHITVTDVCSCLINIEDVEYSNTVIKCKSSKFSKN